jgi:hypothetical protein
MIEAIVWYLLVLDCLVYTGMTLSARWHSKKEHHFWKGFPLHWVVVLLYAGLLAWVGSALFRLNILF